MASRSPPALLQVNVHTGVIVNDACNFVRKRGSEKWIKISHGGLTQKGKEIHSRISSLLISKFILHLPIYPSQPAIAKQKSSRNLGILNKNNHTKYIPVLPAKRLSFP